MSRDNSLPPLRALSAFEATARLGTVSAAAQELCVTHGAVSRQLQVLEAWLGITLFVRAGRRLILTDAGSAYAREIGTGFASLMRATEQLKARVRRQRNLRLNALPTFTMRWLLPRLSAWQATEPNIHIEIATSDCPIGELPPGSFDIAIRRASGRQEKHLHRTAFLQERETPVIAPSLLKNRALAAPLELATFTLLEAQTRPDAWERWAHTAGVSEALHAAPRQNFNHYYMALQAALDGLGVALGPIPLLDADLTERRLIAPFPDIAMSTAPYCWVVAREPDAEVSLFCDWLLQQGSGSDTDA